MRERSGSIGAESFLQYAQPLKNFKQMKAFVIIVLGTLLVTSSSWCQTSTWHIRTSAAVFPSAAYLERPALGFGLGVERDYNERFHFGMRTECYRAEGEFEFFWNYPNDPSFTDDRLNQDETGLGLGIYSRYDLAEANAPFQTALGTGLTVWRNQFYGVRFVGVKDQDIQELERLQSTTFFSTLDLSITLTQQFANKWRVGLTGMVNVPLIEKSHWYEEESGSANSNRSYSSSYELSSFYRAELFLSVPLGSKKPAADE